MVQLQHKIDYFQVSLQSPQVVYTLSTAVRHHCNDGMTPSTPPTMPQRNKVGQEDKSARTRAGRRRTLSRSPTVITKTGQLIQSVTIQRPDTEVKLSTTT